MNSEIYKMPKVELHLHLDGSIPIYILEKLTGLPYDEIYQKSVSEHDNTLADYLEHFNFINSFIKTKEDLELISYSLVKELEKENVIYAEVRFAPLDYVSDKISADEVINSVLIGLRKSNIKTNLILCMRRGADYKYNHQVLELAYKFLNNGVVAVDLVGDEVNYSFMEYQNLFDECKKLAIPTTIHAGEVVKRDIKDVLSYTKRIGHGIKIYDDLELIELIKNNNILLEVCPNSNLDTKNALNYTNHPIRKLYDMGVKVSINTDNRTVSNISLTEEYNILIQLLGFTINDLYEMNLNAIDYSFLSSEEKNELRRKLLQK